MTHQAPRKYLRTSDAAAFVGSTKSTMEKLRLAGGGPAYSKLGRVVVYDVDDLLAWVSARKRTSTSEGGRVAQ